jgi:hypothetical protein
MFPASLTYTWYLIIFLVSDESFVTLDIGDIEMSAGSTLSFYVASTARVMAGSQTYPLPDDGVVTLLGPSRYVQSNGGLFGYGIDEEYTW